MFSYLDAGSLSMLAAAVTGGLAGIVVLLSIYWHRFLGIFSKKHRAIADQARSELLGLED